MALKLDAAILKQRFRGCLLGTLLGDCLGAPFEGEEVASRAVLQKYFDKLENASIKSPVKQYTDDTAMTLSVGQSLLDQAAVGGACFEPRPLARLFVNSFFREPRRGYGANIVTVFNKLRAAKLAGDIYRPAREQFDGCGSFGNGGAMRVAPIALAYADQGEMLEVVRRTTLLTHAHRDGVNGALLQALAIHQCLTMKEAEAEGAEGLEGVAFAQKLAEKMKELEALDETEVESMGKEDPTPYQTQLQLVQSLLSRGDDPTTEEVVDRLGHSIMAKYSVPTAIYAFLRACKPISTVETNNKFRRAIQYAVSLGGDTDTIASMAGSIAGAYYGHQAIPPSLIKHCEGHELMLQLADDLHSSRFN